MGWFELTFIYIVSWWLVLFLLLPIKAGAAENPEKTEYHAAPAKSYLKQKLLGATALAAIVTIILATLIESGTIALWLPYRF